MRIGFYGQVFESLGVEYLSACLQQADHETFMFFDPQLGRDTFVMNGAIARMLDVEDLLVEDMAAAGLDVAAFSVMTDTFANALRVARKLKARTNIPTVFGGIHVSSAPQRVAAEPGVDFAVMGEGEQALVDLVGALESGDTEVSIPNVCYCRDGKVVMNELRPLVENLDGLPFADSDLYWRKARGYRSSCYNIIASRGCTYACTYCCNSLMRDLYRGKGNWYRRRSVGNVIDELQQARQRLCFNRVQFWDDNLVNDRDWLNEFSTRYRREVGLPFFAWAHPRDVDDTVARLLEEAGCQEISLGVQSVFESTRRKFLHRYETNDEVCAAIASLSKTGMFVSAQNILQLPGQTLDEARALPRFYHEHPVDIAHVQLLRYYPGTQIVGYGLAEGLITTADVDRYEAAESARLLSVASAEDRREYLAARHFTVLLSVIPRCLAAFFLENNRFERLPITRTSHVFILLCGWLKRLLSRKRRFVMNYTVSEYLRHYLYFTGMKLRRCFGRPCRATDCDVARNDRPRPQDTQGRGA